MPNLIPGGNSVEAIVSDYQPEGKLFEEDHSRSEVGRITRVYMQAYHCIGEGVPYVSMPVHHKASHERDLMFVSAPWPEQ